ncbi:MAG: hypothetical protein ABI847_01640 [Anaerolineales bacterium]
MTIKRWIVAFASIIISALLTYVIIYVRLPLGPVTIGFGSDVAKFAYSNVALLFISLAAFFGIWLDYFLGTQILKS